MGSATLFNSLFKPNGTKLEANQDAAAQDDDTDVCHCLNI